MRARSNICLYKMNQCCLLTGFGCPNIMWYQIRIVTNNSNPFHHKSQSSLKVHSDFFRIIKTYSYSTILLNFFNKTNWKKNSKFNCGGSIITWNQIIRVINWYKPYLYNWHSSTTIHNWISIHRSSKNKNELRFFSNKNRTVTEKNCPSIKPI